MGYISRKSFFEIHDSKCRGGGGEGVTCLKVVLYFIWPALGSEANIAFFRLDDLSLPLFSSVVLRPFISKISVFILYEILNPILLQFYFSAFKICRTINFYIGGVLWCSG